MTKHNNETDEDLSDLKAAMDFQTLAHFLNLTQVAPSVHKARKLTRSPLKQKMGTPTT